MVNAAFCPENIYFCQHHPEGRAVNFLPQSKPTQCLAPTSLLGSTFVAPLNIKAGRTHERAADAGVNKVLAAYVNYDTR